MKNIYALIRMSLIFLISTNTQAAIFCATNSQDLDTALTIASDNGEDDFIRVASGDYEGGFVYDAMEDFNLTVAGGFTEVNGNPCGERTGHPYDTVLDGTETERVMLVRGVGNARLRFSHLTFTNGFEPGLGAGFMVSAFPDYLGEIFIENAAFINNEANAGAALTLRRSGKITVRNNVFATNNTPIGNGVIEIETETAAVYFINNTVTNNTHDSDNPLAISGLKILPSDSAKVFVANNILWGNENTDLLMSSNNLEDTFLYNNNIDVQLASFNTSSENISGQPLFTGGFFAFEPILASPEINQGRNPPVFVPVPITFEFDWSPGLFDFNGNPRIQDGLIEIGAVEIPPEIPIFKNGFGPAE